MIRTFTSTLFWAAITMNAGLTITATAQQAEPAARQIAQEKITQQPITDPIIAMTDDVMSRVFTASTLQLQPDEIALLQRYRAENALKSVPNRLWSNWTSRLPKPPATSAFTWSGPENVSRSVSRSVATSAPPAAVRSPLHRSGDRPLSLAVAESNGVISIEAVVATEQGPEKVRLNGSRAEVMSQLDELEADVQRTLRTSLGL